MWCNSPSVYKSTMNPTDSKVMLICIIIFAAFQIINRIHHSFRYFLYLFSYILSFTASQTRSIFVSSRNKIKPRTHIITTYTFSFKKTVSCEKHQHNGIFLVQNFNISEGQRDQCYKTALSLMHPEFIFFYFF